MSLDIAITKNKSWLKFRIPLPEMTSKSSQYPYQKSLINAATEYLKKNYPGAKCANRSLIRYQEIFDGRLFLQLAIPIFNHKNEIKIILIEN